MNQSAARTAIHKSIITMMSMDTTDTTITTTTVDWIKKI
jgi:hypothetical protein